MLSEGFFLLSNFSRPTVCQETIRLKPGNKTFNTEARPVWLNFITSTYLSHNPINRGSVFEASPNDDRSLI
jgi:hypothetical protein